MDNTGKEKRKEKRSCCVSTFPSGIRSNDGRKDPDAFVSTSDSAGQDPNRFPQDKLTARSRAEIRRSLHTTSLVTRVNIASPSPEIRASKKHPSGFEQGLPERSQKPVRTACNSIMNRIWNLPDTNQQPRTQCCSDELCRTHGVLSILQHQ